MKPIVTILLFSTQIFGYSFAQNTNSMIDKTTVENVNLDKYLGTWYEIARFPHSFEKNLVGVTATYSYRKDGKIKVVNQGYKNHLNGQLTVARGKAKVPDPKDPARLKVSFFLFFYADYYILELDQENYQWAMIGSSSDNYLWFLSRTPKMDEEVVNMMRRRASERGYDLSRLEEVPQKPL